MTIRNSEFNSNNQKVMTVFGGMFITIDHSEFISNTGYWIVDASNTSVTKFTHSQFVDNSASQWLIYLVSMQMISITHSTFVGNINTYYYFSLIYLDGSKVTTYFNDFVNNRAKHATVSIRAVNTSVHHSKFINNTVTGSSRLLEAHKARISVTHNEFIDNYSAAVHSMLYLDGIMITVRLDEFISNNVIGRGLVNIQYYTITGSLTNNVFNNNSAAYEIYINPSCRPGLNLSLGSSRCIQCSESWLRNMIGIVVAAFTAGIALVILMLALNMTVAVVLSMEYSSMLILWQ